MRNSSYPSGNSLFLTDFLDPSRCTDWEHPFLTEWEESVTIYQDTAY